MYAFLSFIRKNEKDINILGINKATSIPQLEFELRSGQPCIVVINKNVLSSFYLIDNMGNLHQIYGLKDDLFDLDKLFDLSVKNLKKYNYITQILTNSFSELSIAESKYNKKELEELEERIFHNFLHIDMELQTIKLNIVKEINKLSIDKDIKNRLIINVKNTKIINRKLLRKKIDIDLSGYLIKINTFIS